MKWGRQYCLITIIIGNDTFVTVDIVRAYFFLAVIV